MQDLTFLKKMAFCEDILKYFANVVCRCLSLCVNSQTFLVAWVHFLRVKDGFFFSSAFVQKR